jgi:hypothetical protein
MSFTFEKDEDTTSKKVKKKSHDGKQKDTNIQPTKSNSGGSVKCNNLPHLFFNPHHYFFFLLKKYLCI